MGRLTGTASTAHLTGLGEPSGCQRQVGYCFPLLRWSAVTLHVSLQLMWQALVGLSPERPAAYLATTTSHPHALRYRRRPSYERCDDACGELVLAWLQVVLTRSNGRGKGAKQPNGYMQLRREVESARLRQSIAASATRGAASRPEAGKSRVAPGQTRRAYTRLLWGHA